MAKVGEILLCSKDTNGKLKPLEYFNGRTIECIGGGHNKMFIVEASGQVTALHLEEAEPGAAADIEAQSLVALGPLAAIQCGKFANLFLSREGFVYSYGNGIFGVLGHGGSLSLARPELIKVLSDKFIVSIACGEAHCLALSKEGGVFAWGRGYEGQLGTSKSVEVLSVPKYISSFQGNRITQVACGQRHSVAIDYVGNIYSWGEGRCGQLGRRKERECWVPTLVAFETEVFVAAVAAGAAHTMVLTERGRVYVWGMNCYGQLGLGDKRAQ